MKKILFVFSLIVVILMLFYPNLEFYNDNYFFMMSYSKFPEESKDIEELEQKFCYSENYSYNKDRDISIINWEYKNFLFFRWFKVKYEKGNICANEFLLEESYIDKFIKKAKIISNEDNINLSKLIDGKEAIVGNIRYPWNDNSSYIGYELDGRYMDMYISRCDGLIIIQVGLSDEGPKYIAYK